MTATDDTPTFEAGRWYMFGAPDFFTMVGQYVRPIGNGQHRFNHVIYLINGGGQTLPETCRKGPTTANSGKYSPPFPRPWNGAVKWSTEHIGPTPWAKGAR